MSAATPRATPVNLTARTPQSGRVWRAQWVAVTAAAAFIATLADAALLQRRRSYFTGGFLSAEHITNAGQAAGFVFGSLLADFAVLGVFAALAMWAFVRFKFSPRVSLVGACVVSLAPTAAANFVTYQLLTFLGDAFDFALMFDLVGHSPAEILAVSSAHAIWVTLMMTAAVIAVAIIIVLLHRRARSLKLNAEPPPLSRALALPVLLLFVGIVGTAALRSSSGILDNGLRRKPTGRALGAIMAMLSDVDRDGFGLLGRPSDPAPFDSNISPYAVDVPGNGVDEDGVGGDLPADVEPYKEHSDGASIWPFKPDVVLVVLESFRADAVGASVDGKPVTPVLDALAAAGVSARHAYSHNGYTVQSRRHIFSGSVAGVRGTSTLLDDFKANGYETAYFSAQDESFGGVAGGIGFDRADVKYDARDDVALRYSTFTTAGSLALPHSVLVDKVRQFLVRRSADRPLFLYVNFHDTHFPYHHRDIQPLLNAPVLAQFDIRPDRAADLRAMYLNTAKNVDRAIGTVLESVRASLAHEPGVIVLADHGESLFDEGFLGHGYALNDAQTRIPLIVANLPIAITEPFGQADLRDAVGTTLAAVFEGCPTIRADPDRTVFQYLGSVERPAQIAFTRLDGRVVYDFRTRRVQVSGNPWRRPDELEPSDIPRFLELIRAWERMMLRKSAARSH